MVARVRLWWKQIKTHPITTALIVLFIMFVVLVIFGGYKLNWAWTGFNGTDKTDKTLYDWMQLLFIPVVLAVAGFLFNHRERKAAELRAEADKEIEQEHNDAAYKLSIDTERENSLQMYLDNMSQLLLVYNLRKSQINDEVRYIARARTLTILSQLDALRKKIVIQFLYEANLINKNVEGNIVNLEGANLDGDYPGLTLRGVCLRNLDIDKSEFEGADLSEADLSNSSFYDCNMRDCDLSYATLIETYIQDTLLNDADLHNANLYKADLGGSDLTGANLSGANLSGAFIGFFSSPDKNYNFCRKAANLINANLSNVILVDTDLNQTNLTGANLSGADFSGANLTKAIVTPEQLDKARSLKGATMPDGSIHD